MGKGKGHFIPLSLPRRMIGDFLYASKQLALVPGERRMELAPLVSARNASFPRPSWLAMFIKALANVAVRRPELRRVFVERPWHQLFEYDENVISIIIERDCGGEPGLFIARLHSPEKMSLSEIDAKLRYFKDTPLEEIPQFRTAMRLAKLPLFLRRMFWRLVMNWMPRLRARVVGTLGVSLTAGMGGVALSLITPWTMTIFYDIFDKTGGVTVRAMIDHRVFDGKMSCWISKEVERELLGPILAEVSQRTRAAA